MVHGTPALLTELGIGCARGGFLDPAVRYRQRTNGLELFNHRLYLGPVPNVQLASQGLCDRQLIHGTFCLLALRKLSDHWPATIEAARENSIPR